MNIRPLVEKDHTVWLDLWQGYLTFYKVDLPDDVNAHVWQRLLNPQDALMGLVAEDENGQLIGFTHYFFHGTTWYKTPYCYLEDLYVDSKVRSKGAGRALIEAVKQAALKEGAAKLYWHTDKSNETAQALYNKVATLSDFIRYDIPL